MTDHAQRASAPPATTLDLGDSGGIALLQAMTPSPRHRAPRHAASAPDHAGLLLTAPVSITSLPAAIAVAPPASLPAAAAQVQSRSLTAARPSFSRSSIADLARASRGRRAA